MGWVERIGKEGSGERWYTINYLFTKWTNHRESLVTWPWSRISKKKTSGNGHDRATDKLPVHSSSSNFYSQVSYVIKVLIPVPCYSALSSQKATLCSLQKLHWRIVGLNKQGAIMGKRHKVLRLNPSSSLASCVPWTSYLTSPSQYFYVLNAVYNSHLLVKVES